MYCIDIPFFSHFFFFLLFSRDEKVKPTYRCKRKQASYFAKRGEIRGEVDGPRSTQ